MGKRRTIYECPKGHRSIQVDYYMEDPDALVCHKCGARNVWEILQEQCFVCGEYTDKYLMVSGKCEKCVEKGA